MFNFDQACPGLRHSLSMRSKTSSALNERWLEKRNIKYGIQILLLLIRVNTVFRFCILLLEKYGLQSNTVFRSSIKYGI
jgi:hypothetical protein